MLINKANLILQWDDGRSVHIGSLDIETTKTGVTTTGNFRIRLGWEFIRKGFLIMLPGHKWKQEDSEVRC